MNPDTNPENKESGNQKTGQTQPPHLPHPSSHKSVFGEVFSANGPQPRLLSASITFAGIALGVLGAPVGAFIVALVFSRLTGSASAVIGGAVLVCLSLVAGWLAGAFARNAILRVVIMLLFAAGFVALPIAVITAICGGRGF